MAKKEVHVEDLPVSDFPAWLAGMFEIGGSMKFDISRYSSSKGVKAYAYPLIKFSDKDETHVRKLQDIAGGSIYKYGDPGHPHTLTWQAISERAVTLAKVMDDFALLRKSDIVAYRQWEEEPDLGKRIDIAMEHRRRSIEEQPVWIEEYQPLVDHHEFTAGVIDSRGGFFPRHGSINPPRLIIYGSNKPLLDAVQSKYGGTVGINHKQGAVRKTPYGEAVVRRDTFRLEIGGKKLKELYLSVASYLLLHDTADIERKFESKGSLTTP